ncbi:uncharacterized protein VP01_1167g2 [Puccinia sorghi]|uniref:Uncharacterized protein n=1 Tax=Puccinia sorghi TaxID=27349 RepID=A0A0L6VRJ2_9BASI|nr:uncharacterized protein VP01_1167g2 [Puccinia sorghi]
MVVANKPGVNMTHSPKKHDFEWLPVPRTIKSIFLLSIPLQTYWISVLVHQILSCSRGTMFLPRFVHFHNNNTPLTRTHVGMQGTMTGFLGYSMIPFNVHQIASLLSNTKSTIGTTSNNPPGSSTWAWALPLVQCVFLSMRCHFFENVLKTTPEYP